MAAVAHSQVAASGNRAWVPARSRRRANEAAVHNRLLRRQRPLVRNPAYSHQPGNPAHSHRPGNPAHSHQPGNPAHSH